MMRTTGTYPMIGGEKTMHQSRYEMTGFVVFLGALAFVFLFPVFLLGLALWIGHRLGKGGLIS